jgi:hypothetical protein
MRTVLRHLLESLASPTLLLSNRFNGRVREAAADQVAANYSRASHFSVSTVPHRILLLSGISPSITESANENRPHRDIDEKRLKYFLVEEVPASTKTIHLIFNADSHWLHVRMWVDTFKIGEKPLVGGRISVHNSLVHLYNPAEFVVTCRSMFSSRSSKKGMGRTKSTAFVSLLPQDGNLERHWRHVSASVYWCYE